MADKEVQGNKFDLKILRRLLQFVKPYKNKFRLLIFTILAAALIAPLLPVLIQQVIDTHLIEKDYHGMLNMLWLMIALLLGQALLQFTNTYMSGWLGQMIIRDIRSQLFSHIAKLRLTFFDRTPIGQLVTRCISDIETLAEVFSQGLAALSAEILQLIAIVSTMFFLNWKLTLISLSTFPLLLISTYIFKEKIKSSYNLVRTAVSNLNTFVQEHVTGMNIVQIFNAEDREYEKFYKINDAHRKANLKSVKYYSIYFPVAEVIGAIGTGLVVWFGGQQMISGFVSGPGELVMFMMFLNMFFRPIRMIADRFNTLQMGIISTSRIIKLLDNTDYISNEGAVNAEKLNGKISFKNVWFAYKDEDYVLKDITFDVEQGQSIAFVGATGAGKSSIINLLNRYYEINKGSIEIDGGSINNFTLESLRKNIGVVLQDVFLFSDSIRENITLGNTSITDDEIWNAVDMVGARDFIEKLPGKLDYNVKERGVSLSVGQRQLISFVRAMVYNPQIMVLDEATSSIDTETEHLVQQAIEKLLDGRTSIVIAHRLSTIQKADKIIVMDKGEIKEIGSHNELIAKKGYYWQLHQLQYKNAS